MISVRECSRSLKIVSVPASAFPLTLLAVLLGVVPAVLNRMSHALE